MKDLERNTITYIGKEEIDKKLLSGQKLRVKFGVDPTRPDLTFGHLVILNKLRQLQDDGHTVVLIIGDFTTRIGDPSGRSSTRPVLSEEEIENNASTYLSQVFRVLDKSKTEVHKNSEWFSSMSFMDLLVLSRHTTVARMLERDDFSKRYADKVPISLIEFLYPLLQGWDSVKINSDIEMGGNDQIFNMLMGRQLQKDEGLSEQAVLSMPLLVGLDGKKKMSKSYDNYISFNDTPKDMFGKIMSVSDETMWIYQNLLCLKSDEEISILKQKHPMEVKLEMAKELVSKLYGKEIGEQALNNFRIQFQKKEIPDDLEEFITSETSIVNILVSTGLFKSKNEIKRLIEQKAVKIGGIVVGSINEEVKERPVVVSCGRKKFSITNPR